MKRFLLLISVLTLPLMAQHDPGRDAVRILAKGDADKALEVVAKDPQRMNSPIDEAEKAFVRAMVACQQGKVEEAFALVKAAVGKGMPVERLLAGPRDLLKPLHEHEPFRAWVWRNPVAAPSPAQMVELQKQRVLHGPMLGAVTDTTASFWVRTGGEANVQVNVRPVDSETEVVTATAKTSAENDYTVVLCVEGLKPGTDYQYQLGAPTGGLDFSGPLLLPSNNGVVTLHQRFRTFPKNGSPSRFHIAFGGGAGYTPQYERMWTTIAKREPSALLLLGDNVYIDDPEHLLTNDYCYYRRQSVPQWRALVAKTPVFAIYDDHDFGINDCNPGPKIDEPAWKRPVWQTFRNNWANPSYGGGDKQPGCWFDFIIGQVHFIMLDCRFYRDLEGGSMLGPVQKAWLLDTLKNSKGVFKVIVSSVPWSPGVKPGSKDTWDGFAAEREEIFSTIEKHKISGVLLMAADRHRTDYRKIPRPAAYDLYEVMSSRLTNVHTHGLTKQTKGSEFIMGYNEKCSFGQVEFDTTAKDPTITYTIVNIDNEEVGKASLKMSELSFAKGE